MTGLLLGLDIGTSSSKGVLVEPGGRVVATAERSHGVSMPQPGWFEHDADTVWWAEACAILRELVQAARAIPIAGVGISGLGPCVLLADEHGRPLRPAILYGVDTRAQVEIDELLQRGNVDEMLQRGGSPLTSQAAGPKLLWTRRHDPEVWSKARRFFMASSFLVHRLTGEYVLDHHSASQCNPLYDLSAAGWNPAEVDHVVGDLEMPALHWPAEVAGVVTADAATDTGLAAGTPVITGTVDAWAEALSVGVEQPGSAMLMYGTTMFIVAATASARPDARLWQTAGVPPGSRTVAAGLATSGAVTSWLRDLCGGPPFEDLVAEAAAVAPGAEGLVLLPYFAGERTPLFDPLARGLVCGLTLRHGRGHLYRAALEGTAFGVRHNLEVFGDIGAPVEVLRAVGGGTKGSLWPQIVSDVTGIPQEIPSCTVGAAYGDALLAARAVGLAGAAEQWNTVSATVEPTTSRRPLYDEMYAIYRRLYETTRDDAHALARLQLGASAGS